jgi:hypothetical protein
MAVAHGFGLALNLDLDRAAKTFALMRRHDVHISLFMLRIIAWARSVPF